MPPDASFGRDRAGELARCLEYAPDVVEVVVGNERHAVGLTQRYERVLRKDQVGVERAVAIRVALADERDGRWRPLDRQHLARAAPIAARVAVGKRHLPVGPL